MSVIPITAQTVPGVWTALVTPFRGRTINWEVWEALVERAAAAKITGIVVLGSTGESPAVAESERERLIARAVEIARKRLYVMVGAGSFNQSHAIHQVKQAASLGADSVLVVTPYYNKPTQTGLRRYFLAIAEKSPLPIILYHIPGRCGVGISPRLTLRLANHPQIIGLKDAGGDVARVGDIVSRAPEDFTVLSGDDPLTLPMMALGAKGVVSVLSNIVPNRVRELVEAASRGAFIEALTIHKGLTPLNSTFFLETNPAPVKEAMNQAGIRVGSVRPPLAPVSAKTRNALKAALKLAGELR